MRTLEARCSNCGKKSGVPVEAAGGTVVCGRCGWSFLVPLERAESSRPPDSDEEDEEESKKPSPVPLAALCLALVLSLLVIGVWSAIGYFTRFDPGAYVRKKNAEAASELPQRFSRLFEGLDKLEARRIIGFPPANTVSEPAEEGKLHTLDTYKTREWTVAVGYDRDGRLIMKTMIAN